MFINIIKSLGVTTFFKCYSVHIKLSVLTLKYWINGIIGLIQFKD